jgi:sterol desaturase/sphingolipid hydroxylase (fatty acid hydroxylase superfamily)
MKSIDLSTWPLEIGRLAIWLALLALLFVPLERLFAARQQPQLRQQWSTDVAYYFINNLLPAALLSLPLAALAWVAHQVVPSAVSSNLSSLPVWAALPLAMVVGDIGYYWGHRASHRVPFLWRFHQLHHSATQMDFLVHTRGHPLDVAFGRFCGLIPIYALGLGDPRSVQGSLVPLVAILFGTVWGFFIHSNLRWRLGPLESLIASPAFHHWHHTRSAPIDRNFSSMFPWLDRAFGTLHLPAQLPQDYGIAAPTPPTLFGQLMQPFRGLDALSESRLPSSPEVLKPSRSR